MDVARFLWVYELWEEGKRRDDCCYWDSELSTVVV